MRDTSPARATPAARSQASSILSAAATGLVSFILLEGGDPDRVLGLAGVSATALGQPASSLGLDLYCRVMEQAAADTCNGNFGLRYGQQYEPGQLGLLGYVALASPTVGAAFENISGLFHHHQQRSILRVVRQPELSRIEYQILDRSIAARRQDAELSLGMFFNILRHALGSRWSPEAVLFEHARPESWPEHERSFGAPALFAQPCNAIVLPTRQLDAPMPGADAHLLALLRHNPGPAGAGGHAGRIAGRARRRRHPPPAGRRRAFARRCGAGAEHPELDAAAAPAQPRLHLSGVAAGGAPRAGAQLSEGSRDPDFRTGFPARLFRDQRVFRAFHRWLGMSPSEWRRGYLEAGGEA